MRTAARRITRKDLRQPDSFVLLARRFVAFAKENRNALAAAAVVVVFVVGALFGWELYKSRQNRLAAEEYGRAVDLYHLGKYKEALDALGRLEIYRSSYYSRLGLLYQANAQAAMQDTGRAAETLRQLLDREKKDPMLRQSAYLALGYNQEQREQWGDAAQSFTEAEKIPGPLQSDATLGKGRSYLQTGNLKEAAAAYKK
ncbi:MAG TPA: tetratricopeptide repeat protein, partial [Candidatus Binatia bacterium]|nr:tetratricopeptide repeat protein [Candidatus Binatia bacterium]